MAGEAPGPWRSCGRLNQDFIDLLRSLLQEEALLLVVGAYAMAAHGVPRATGGIDVWVEADDLNAARVFRALARFGAPLDVKESDFAGPDRVVQTGFPPRRIDVLTGVSGLKCEAAWAGRTAAAFSALKVPVIGRDHLIANKRAAGRPKDLADLAVLDPQSK